MKSECNETYLLVFSPEPPSYQTPGLTACQEPLQDWSSSLKKRHFVILKLTKKIGEEKKRKKEGCHFLKQNLYSVGFPNCPLQMHLALY